MCWRRTSKPFNATFDSIRKDMKACEEKESSSAVVDIQVSFSMLSLFRSSSATGQNPQAGSGSGWVVVGLRETETRAV